MSELPASPGDGDLLFVYAADSGLFNTLSDIAHKVFSPASYPCQLCSLTHGYFSVRAEWQDFLASLPVSCHFLHRDQARDIGAIELGKLPSVYRWQRGAWVRRLDAEDIATCADLAQLQEKIRGVCRD